MESLGLAALIAKRKGEMSDAEFYVLMASEAYDHLSEYSMRGFSELAPSLLEYAKARVHGHRPRDQDTEKQIGSWLHYVQTVHELNEVNRSLIMWAAEKLHLAGLAEKAEKLRMHLNRAPFPRPPNHSYGFARHCQQLK